jgi:DNA-binding NarL/FixJ family response regulator
MVRFLRCEAHIVVVDARPKDYRDLALLAGENRWHLHFFTTGHGAIRYGRPGHSDLWIINVSLPDMSGLDLLETVAQNAGAARFFIIADRYGAEDERRACQSGAALYLCKDAAHSIDFKQLLQLATEKRADQPLNTAVS